MQGNRLREAFTEAANVVCLASAAALSAGLQNPEPLWVGLVAETAYLLCVPRSRWYAARLARRMETHVDARRQMQEAQRLPRLRVEMRARFQRLKDLRRQIDAQAQDDAHWYSDLFSKLDYLLDRFLLFASKEQEFRNYLQSLLAEARGSATAGGKPMRIPQTLPSTMPDAWVSHAVAEVQADYSQERDGINKRLASETEEDSKAVLQKRADVLARRGEYVGKIGKALTNLTDQLQLLEDTFGLISDEVRARSPEQVLSDVDDVVTQADVMSKTLEEIAPFEQMVARA